MTNCTIPQGLKKAIFAPAECNDFSKLVVNDRSSHLSRDFE
jgi:hypothetical protein